MSLGRQVTGPTPRAMDLDLAQPTQVAAYRAYTEGLLPSLPSTDSPEDASLALRSLCLDTASWLQEQGQRKAIRSRVADTTMDGLPRLWLSRRNW